MSGTNAYAIKAALIALFKANAVALAAGTSQPGGPGQAQIPVDVSYGFPVRDVPLRLIYGQTVRFDHDEDVAEGVGVLVREQALISIVIRVCSRPARPAEEDDADIQVIGGNMLTLMKATAQLTGPTRWLGVSGGLGVAGGSSAGGGGATVATDHESISVLGYQFRFGSRLSY